MTNPEFHLLTRIDRFEDLDKNSHADVFFAAFMNSSPNICGVLLN